MIFCENWFPSPDQVRGQAFSGSCFGAGQGRLVLRSNRGEEFVQRTLIPTLLFACVVLSSGPCAADGALAIGLPKDVARQGFSFGYSNNHPVSDARDIALKGCRENKGGSAQSKAICTVIQTYSNQCVAVAMDPVAGTPGVGWAVADDLRAAESKALANCEATAGPGRRAACKIDHSQCDGAAK
jgi:hypothetical protein